MPSRGWDSTCACCEENETWNLQRKLVVKEESNMHSSCRNHHPNRSRTAACATRMEGSLPRRPSQSEWNQDQTERAER